MLIGAIAKDPHSAPMLRTIRLVRSTTAAPAASKYADDRARQCNDRDRMAQAVFDQDRRRWRVFTDDLAFPPPRAVHRAGDHHGIDGFLGVLGTVFELTSGDIKLEQLFCLGTDGWAAEWERAVLGRNGKTLESNNAFVYRFEGERIAEMWMFIGALPERAASFFE
jgi:ketosteroid isomerase-like protein